MSTETVTVFRDSYRQLQNNEFKYMTDLAHLQGTIIALADIIDTNPDYVKKTLKNLQAEFNKKETA